MGGKIQGSQFHYLNETQRVFYIGKPLLWRMGLLYNDVYQTCQKYQKVSHGLQETLPVSNEISWEYMGHFSYSVPLGL